MTKINLITQQSALNEVCETLTDCSWIAIDTEFMREKTYAPILCLIQLATTDQSFIIDPLEIDDLDPFGQLIDSDQTETILHSCRQDFEALDTRTAYSISRMFDTQVAAAFCGYGDQVSYAAMVENICDIKLAKSHTRADWQRRPLADEELEYAMDDVVYLHAVREHLASELERLDRWSWFSEECERQLDPATWRANPDDAWQRLKGAATLEIEAQDTARKLAVWREHTAINRNRPREWILATAALLEISKRGVRNTRDLGQIEGVNPGVVRNSGNEILEVCKSANRQQDAIRVWTHQRMLEPEEKKQVKGVMTLIRNAAEELGISPALLANRRSVEKFVRGGRELDLLKGWRLDVVGEKILADYS